METLAGVGPKLAERLAASGVRTVGDLLMRLPIGFQDRTRIVPLADLEPGEGACFCAEVVHSAVRFGRRRSLLCEVADDSGALRLRFFHFNEGQRRALAAGTRVFGYGEPRAGREGLEMVHPEYRILAGGAEPALASTLTPVYPTREGLGQARMRKLLEAALGLLEAGAVLPDTLPGPVRERFGLASLSEAVAWAHRPPAGPVTDGPGTTGALRQRLALDELLAHHLSLRVLRSHLDRRRAPALGDPGDLGARLLRALPFALTAAQARALDEIRADLARPRPMHRLLQGDVGSGKTVVAALAAAHCIEHGHQAALMAPTELLAEQHLRALRAWLEPLGVAVGWLGGKLTAAARREALAGLANGEVAMVVGTHALVQEPVQFARLGLAIIDEQHRFGVDQRLRLGTRLDAEERRPHVLVMTATPIPRTLAMVAYADLDSSIIDELPPGRTPVHTAALASSRRDEVIERIARACGEGQQAYWVCPLVEESDALDSQAAIEVARELGERLKDLRVGLVHGRMSSPEKDATMSAFRAGEIHVLVATTVIEVGVDVPNASLMVIENAERLGLAQLHQLRGRVGRGRRKSACVLMHSPRPGRRARTRLEALRASNDGFFIAERDLELRGPGEVLGVRQAGSFAAHHANLTRDAGLLPLVERLAAVLMEEYPEAVEPLTARWAAHRAEYASA